MEIGIDSFAASELSVDKKRVVNGSQVINHLIDRIVAADEAGLDVFGIGEHHRKEFLDSSPALILAAAAARTKKIKLTSAVTVLSADDPVRVFQDYATLDLISNGRAEMVVGRGSFVDAYPLFGYELKDYDALFAEKLDLLLKIQRSDTVTWQGRFRAPLRNQPIFPRPVQEPLRIWLGVGGTPQSFVRAGSLGMPLMVAIIGGETHRFRPLVDLYREAGIKAGYSEDQLTVGIHSFGYVADSTRIAADEAYPGMAAAFEKIREERGWPPLTRSQFDAQMGPLGSYLIGGPDEVAEKIVRHSQALGGVSRVTFQMDVLNMGQEKLLQSIQLIGNRVATHLRSA